LCKVSADRINIVQILEIRDHVLIIRAEPFVDRNTFEIVDWVIVKLDTFYRFDLALADCQKHVQIMLVPVFPEKLVDDIAADTVFAVHHRHRNADLLNRLHAVPAIRGRTLIHPGRA